MQIVLKNVILSFPSLWEPKASAQGGTAKYQAVFLLDKATNSTDITAIRGAMKTVGLAKWPKGIPKGVIPSLKEASTKEYDGYDESRMFVSTSSDQKPVVVDCNPSVRLDESDTKVQAGCIVNAFIKFWAQDNQFGKRINCQLCSVQFVDTGTPFGEKLPDPETVFSNIAGSPTAEEPFETVTSPSVKKAAPAKPAPVEADPFAVEADDIPF